MINIPFLDLKRQLASIRSEVDGCFQRVLDSGHFILGQEGAAFEAEFAAYHNAQFAAAVGNGTDALDLALRAGGNISPGENHEVITTPLTAGFTVLGILMAGAVPVFADILDDTLLIDPASVEALVGPRTRALLPVHLYGQVCDMTALRRIADRHGLFLLEDCSQAHGSRFDGKLAGTLGDAGTFSFYPTKNLGAYGDGGLVLSNSKTLIDRIHLIRKGGVGPDSTHLAAGVNSRLDEVQAAVLRAKLPHLEDWNRRRVALAAKYHERLRGTRARPCLPSTSLAATTSLEAGHNYHLYVIRHPERDRLRNYLYEKGIQALIHYPQPLHRHPAFCAFARPDSVPRIAEKACVEILSLPLYPELEEEEQNQVIAAICEYDRLYA